MQSWQMQKAKAQLSELVKSAQTVGPQEITLHGKSVAVVVSREAFDRMASSGETLVSFMQRSPLYGIEDLEFERDASPPRETEL
jgi:prevent-host-death family protein